MTTDRRRFAALAVLCTGMLMIAGKSFSVTQSSATGDTTAPSVPTGLTATGSRW